MTPTDTPLTPEGGGKKEERVVISKPGYKALYEVERDKRRAMTILLWAAFAYVITATGVYVGTLIYLVNQLKP